MYPSMWLWPKKMLILCSYGLSLNNDSCNKLHSHPNNVFNFFRSFGMIKPDGIVSKGDILCCIFDCGFQISRLKMAILSKEEASQFYEDHQGKSFFP